MIKRSNRLQALARILKVLDEDGVESRDGDSVTDAISNAVGPQEDTKEARAACRNEWVVDNDWQSMMDRAEDAFEAGVRVASLLKGGESVWKVQLEFGGGIDPQVGTVLFLGGTEDEAAAVLQSVIDQFPAAEDET